MLALNEEKKNTKCNWNGYNNGQNFSTVLSESKGLMFSEWQYDEMDLDTKIYKLYNALPSNVSSPSDMSSSSEQIFSTLTSISVTTILKHIQIINTRHINIHYVNKLT